MEEARVEEKTKLNGLQNNLYEMQRKMQTLQSQLEAVSFPAQLTQYIDLREELSSRVGL